MADFSTPLCLVRQLRHLPATFITMKKVSFICTQTAARSQIAEGIVSAHQDNHYEAYSAGTHPAGVYPCAIAVMKEIDIDITKHRSKSLDEFREKEFDYAITLCDNSQEACPFFPQARSYLHKSFSDPAHHQGTAEEKLLAFRQVRDEIATWIHHAFKPTGIESDER